MRIKPMKRFDAILTPPPDKSVTIRALVMGLIARGKTVISDPLISGDTVSAMNAVASLGAELDIDKGVLSVTGGKMSSGKVDAGNSATTARLLVGAIAGRVDASITGDDSLKRRTMRPLIDALGRMGANITSKNGFLPLEVRKSELNGIDLIMETPSAQIKSAVLLAGLCASGETRVRERIKTRTHTEDMLPLFGADIRVEDGAICVRRSELVGAKIDVFGDISSAAYPIVLALKKGSCYIKNVGTARRELIDFLRKIGAHIEEESFGDRANLLVKRSELTPFVIEGELSTALIDELPLLTVLACTIEGESRISDAGALRNKECDRIKCTASNLRSMGADIEETSDGFVIRGGKLVGGNAITMNDHRMAMSLAVANALSEKGGSVDNDKCVEISYPSFWELFL